MISLEQSVQGLGVQEMWRINRWRGDQILRKYTNLSSST